MDTTAPGAKAPGRGYPPRRSFSPSAEERPHHRKRQTMHLRTALLRPVLRCGWGPTQTVFERVAARPSHGLDLLAKRSFP